MAQFYFLFLFFVVLKITPWFMQFDTLHRISSNLLIDFFTELNYLTLEWEEREKLRVQFTKPKWNEGNTVKM